MSQIAWREILGFNEDQLKELCFAGYAYLKQGQYDAALDFFRALVILDSENPYYLQILGGIYLEKNNPLAALNYFEKAIRLDPENSQTLLNRTKALFALGYKKQAVTQAKKIANHPDKQISGQAQALLLAYP